MGEIAGGQLVKTGLNSSSWELTNAGRRSSGDRACLCKGPVAGAHPEPLDPGLGEGRARSDLVEADP